MKKDDYMLKPFYDIYSLLDGFYYTKIYSTFIKNLKLETFEAIENQRQSNIISGFPFFQTFNAFQNFIRSMIDKKLHIQN